MACRSIHFSMLTVVLKTVTLQIHRTGLNSPFHWPFQICKLFYVNVLKMVQFDNILLQLRESPEYQKVIHGKGEFSNFIKRHEALGRVFVDRYLRELDESCFHSVGGKENAISEVQKIYGKLTGCCRSFLSGDIATAISLM